MSKEFNMAKIICNNEYTYGRVNLNQQSLQKMKLFSLNELNDFRPPFAISVLLLAGLLDSIILSNDSSYFYNNAFF